MRSAAVIFRCFRYGTVYYHNRYRGQPGSQTACIRCWIRESERGVSMKKKREHLENTAEQEALAAQLGESDTFIEAK